MPYTLTNQQKDEIKKRYAAVKCAFDCFRNVLPVFKNNTNNVAMQPEVLYCVIVSWVLDEDRHINFHKCNGLAAHKMASYFLYWFARLKPIQIININNSDSQTVLVNEIFTLFRVCDMLEIKGSKVMPSKFFSDFVYMLRYRKFSAESLFTTMRLFKISANNGTLLSYEVNQAETVPIST